MPQIKEAVASPELVDAGGAAIGTRVGTVDGLCVSNGGAPGSENELSGFQSSMPSCQARSVPRKVPSAIPARTCSSLKMPSD